MNTFSEVLLPALYAACVIGILLDSFWLILLIIHMARIFLMTESRMMCLRFAGGPCDFRGLERGTSIPSFSSSGYSPDLAMLLNISAILMWMTSGLYFSSSAHMLSVPVLLLFCSDLIAFLISSCVKGVNIWWYVFHRCCCYTIESISEIVGDDLYLLLLSAPPLHRKKVVGDIGLF